MTNPPLTTVGGSVAALVAADAAAAAGHRVDAYVPNRGVGAGFAPIRRDGRQLPLGFRVLELVVDADHPRSAPPLADYTPDVANHREYLGMLHTWFEDVCGPLHDLGTLEMFASGRLVPDLYYATDAAAIAPVLTSSEREAIARETAEIVRHLGPAGLLDDPTTPLLWDVDLASISLANHGPTFHRRFVVDVCRKLRDEGPRDVPTPIRRKMWMPVFWPSTLHEVATTGTATWRPTHRRFHDWRDRDAVTALLDRLEAAPSANVRRYDTIQQITSSAGRAELRIDDALVTAQNPVLGIPAGELFALAGLSYDTDRVGVVLAWLEYADADVHRNPGCVMVVDDDVDAFRVSTGGAASAPDRVLFTVELRTSISEKQAAMTAHDSLVRMGLVREGATHDVAGTFAGLAFTAPTIANRNRFLEASSQWQELGLPVRPVAGCAVHAADSLNEQIVQGLAVADAHTSGALTAMHGASA